MIDRLTGRMVEKNAAQCVIDCGGVGYEVNISLQTYERLPQEEAVKLFTHLIVREDAQILFGFATREERSLFRLLISVSGIGPNTARMILSSMTADELQVTIATGNVAALKRVKGIGAKSAERVIIDLKDKVGKIEGEPEFLASGYNTTRDEALKALEVLGYNRQKASKIIDQALASDPQAKVEELIKTALKKL